MKFFLGIVVGLIGLILLLVFVHLLISLGTSSGMQSVRRMPTFELPVYLDFIGVMMTSITVILAAIGIGIALVAVYTFSEIKQDARKAAITKIEEALSPKHIQKLVAEITFAKTDIKKQTPTSEEDFSSGDTDDTDKNWESR